MPKQQQFAVEKLSEAAQALMHQILDQQASPKSIARALRERTGKHISSAAITRYAADYWEQQQKRQQARQRTDALIERARQQGYEISALLRAAVLEAFTQTRRNGPLKKISPLQLESAERKRRELALKEEQVWLTGRRVKVFEQGWELKRKKAQADFKKLDRKAKLGESLTAGDVRRIREIYEIYDEWQPEPDETATDETYGNSQEIEASEIPKA